MSYDKKLESLKIQAGYAKHKYLYKNIGDKKYFLNLYREAENQLDKQNENHCISPSSISIQEALDIGLLKEKRRRNYQYVLSHIKVEAVFKKLNKNEVPLYFPCYVNNRLELQSFLREQQIYAPIIWPKANDIDCVYCEICYEKMLCLPIDQRYDLDDMERMVDAVNEFIK